MSDVIVNNVNGKEERDDNQKGGGGCTTDQCNAKGCSRATRTRFGEINQILNHNECGGGA